MQRARMISTPLPKGTKATLRRRDWGMERSHKTIRGMKYVQLRLLKTNKTLIANSKY